VPAERIEPRILLVRVQRVMLDADLAALYGVPTMLSSVLRSHRAILVSVEIMRAFCDSGPWRGPWPSCAGPRRLPAHHPG
jgi:hypothetical protein